MPVAGPTILNAKRHSISVSKLFSDTIEKLSSADEDLEDTGLKAQYSELYRFLGASDNLESFDNKSEEIINRHG